VSPAELRDCNRVEDEIAREHIHVGMSGAIAA
jgi:hypothetical protein